MVNYYFSYNVRFVLPAGAFLLRGLPAGLVDGGLDRGEIGLGAPPPGFALARGPWPARRGALAKSERWSQIHGVPHPTRPSHAGNVKPGLCGFYVFRPVNSVAARTHA